MTTERSVTGSLPVGSFAEAQRFQLLTALGTSYAERLRDLERMWDFNDMVEELNPRIRRIAALLRARRE